jgi:hypothetical protein
VAQQRQGGQQKPVAAVEHCRGHGAQHQDQRLHQHETRQRDGQAAGRIGKAGGQGDTHKEWCTNFKQQHQQDKTDEQAGQHLRCQTRRGCLSLFPCRLQQDRDQGAGERAASKQAKEHIGQAQGRIKGDRFIAGAELGVKKHLTNRAQERGEEETCHQHTARFRYAALTRRQPAESMPRQHAGQTRHTRPPSVQGNRSHGIDGHTAPSHLPAELAQRSQDVWSQALQPSFTLCMRERCPYLFVCTDERRCLDVERERLRMGNDQGDVANFA